MVPKNRSRPTQRNARVTMKDTMEASVVVTQLEAKVVGMIKRIAGSKL